MIVLLKDACRCPRRFWEALGLILLFVAAIAWGINQGGWAAVILLIVGVWGVFSGCMLIYQVGRQVAYRQAAQWAEETRQLLTEGQGELSAALAELDMLARALRP